MVYVIVLMVQMSDQVYASNGWQIQIVVKRPNLVSLFYSLGITGVNYLGQLLGGLSPIG